MSGGDPVVTAVMPTYNNAEFVRESIDSALSQDYPALEVIVGDDGSTDHTAAVLAEYGDRITVVRHADGRNHGVSPMRNRIIERSSGKYLAFLDADDVWLPGKIAMQVRAMEAQPDAAMCHTAYEKFGDPNDSGEVFNDPAFVYEGHCFDKIFRFNNPCMPTVMMRRDCMPEWGFEDYGVQLEDYALWLQLMFDHPVIYLRKVTTRYRRHPGQATSDDLVQRTMVHRGEVRLRFLNRNRERMPKDLHDELRDYAISELKAHAYSRYWKHDWRYADAGFGIMRRHGQPVPLRYRLRAAIARKLSPK